MRDRIGKWLIKPIGEEGLFRLWVQSLSLEGLRNIADAFWVYRVVGCYDKLLEKYMNIIMEEHNKRLVFMIVPGCYDYDGNVDMEKYQKMVVVNNE